MGRKSRKKRNIEIETTNINKEQTSVIYTAASYVRLSSEDDNLNNNSLINQRNIIQEFVNKNKDITVVAEFEDNGKTGLDFNRDGFKEMMNLVKAGIVNCIIVKDFSRLGRDLVETGNYIEKIFPFMNVRFIAINDNYDSNKDECTSMQLYNSLKLLTNQMYSMDISRKIKSVKHVQQEQGEFVGPCPPFGYLKDKKSKKLIIDPDNSKTIQKIFDLRESGMSYRQIAIYLMENGFKNRISALQEKGYKKNCKVKDSKRWNSDYITKILSNKVYIGCLTQRKEIRTIHGRESLPKDEWIMIENCHDPIISKEQFDRVQAMKKLKTKESKKYEDAIFKGMLFCGDCGYICDKKNVYNKKWEKPKFAYNCSTNIRLGKKSCSSKHIMEKNLLKIVSDIVKVFMQEVSSEHLNCNINHNLIQNKEKIEKEIKNIEEKLNKYLGLRVSLYENYTNGIVDKEDYKDILSQFDSEVSFLTKEKMIQQRQLIRIKQKTEEIRLLFETVNSYEKATEIDSNLLKKLIKKIEIYENKKIKITFNYSDIYKEIIESGEKNG